MQLLNGVWVSQLQREASALTPHLLGGIRTSICSFQGTEPRFTALGTAVASRIGFNPSSVRGIFILPDSDYLCSIRE